MPGPFDLDAPAGGRLGTDPLYGTPGPDPAFNYWVQYGGDPPPRESTDPRTTPPPEPLPGMQPTPIITGNEPLVPIPRPPAGGFSTGTTPAEDGSDYWWLQERIGTRGRVVPRAIGGGSRRVPSGQQSELERSTLPPAIREQLPTRQQIPRARPGVPPKSVRKRSGRTPTPDRGAIESPNLGFLGFVPRTSPRPREVPRIDQPFPNWPGNVVIRVPPRRERRVRPDEFEELRRGGNPFPQPEPDINPRVPQRPPRVIEVPPLEEPISEPEPLRSIPVPSFPEFPAPVVPPPEVEVPPPPVIAPPRAPGLPSRTRKTPKTVIQRITRIGTGVGLATLFRTIYRRKNQESTSLLRRITAPFDPETAQFGDQLEQVRRETTPRVARPKETLGDPFNIEDLTPNYDRQLGFVQQARRARSREEECKCEETEEEKEENRRPSRVVAKVKQFTRRMSQNSLDNLR